MPEVVIGIKFNDYETIGYKTANLSCACELVDGYGRVETCVFNRSAN